MCDYNLVGKDEVKEMMGCSDQMAYKVIRQLKQGACRPGRAYRQRQGQQDLPHRALLRGARAEGGAVMAVTQGDPQPTARVSP